MGASRFPSGHQSRVRRSFGGNAGLAKEVDVVEVVSDVAALDVRIDTIELSLPTKADLTFVNTQLALKADITYVDAGLATKEPNITAGTVAQYWRGDKTFQTLDKAAVGLSNVDNTSDANKPVSTAQQAALDAKLDDTQATAFGLSLLDDPDAATARATLGAAATAHTHVIADVTNLQSSLDAKANLSGATFTGDIYAPVVRFTDTNMFGAVLSGDAYHGMDDFDYWRFIRGTNVLEFRIADIVRFSLSADGLTIPDHIHAGKGIKAKGQGTGFSGSGVELEYAGGIGYVTSYNRSTSAWEPISFRGSTINIQPNGITVASFSPTGTSLTGLTNAIDDTAAAAAGVPLNGVYRNGSQLMVRVT